MIIKFRYKLIFLVSIILIIAGAAYVFVSIQLAGNIERDITERLVKGNETYEEFNKAFFEQLLLQSVSVSDNPKFGLQLSTGDKATVQEGLIAFNQNLNADVLMALTPSGQVLANVGGKMNMGSTTNLSQRPEINDALTGNDNGGFWEEDGKLLRIAASPTIVSGQVQGAIVLGYELGDSAASKIAKVTTSNIAFWLNNKIIATNVNSRRDELTTALQSHKNALDQAVIRKTSSDPFHFMLAGERFLAVVSPIFASPGAEGQENKVLATYVFFNSLDKALEPLVTAQKQMLLIGVSVAIFAFLVALIIINGVNKPVNLLTKAIIEVENGNLDFRVKVKSRDELGQLADKFNEMIEGMKQKKRVEGLFGKYLSPDVAKKVLAEQSVEGILKGEKELLSVMFTDIRGFTPMSRGMDPQALISLLNSHFDESIDIIDRFGGTLDKFIGDAIMAFFGAPVHYDDFYMRAINAAVQIQRATEKFNFQRKLEGKEPINIGVGINTGDVVVGNIGSNKRLEYTVIGETVNIANRLCSVAKKGQIIVSQSTYDLLPNKSIASPIENVMLKGVSEPVTVYEILWKG